MLDLDPTCSLSHITTPKLVSNVSGSEFRTDFRSRMSVQNLQQPLRSRREAVSTM